MPKQPGGITKFQRVLALKEVLSRWGRLNKQQIDQRVASSLGCDADDIGRALYRDLEELEGLGEIVATHFTRDGQEIPDYDPDKQKNTYAEWAIKGFGQTVLGARILQSADATLVVPPRLLRSFRVTDGKEPPDPKFLNLYFRVNNRGVCISLELEALPAKFVLSRTFEGSKDDELLALAGKKFGARAAYLLVPVPNVSRFKGDEQPGHLVIDAQAPGKLTLVDLGSRNGSYHHPLNRENADRLIMDIGYRGEATFSDDIIEYRRGIRPALLPPGASAELSLPVLIQASQAFELVAI